MQHKKTPLIKSDVWNWYCTIPIPKTAKFRPIPIPILWYCTILIGIHQTGRQPYEVQLFTSRNHCVYYMVHFLVFRPFVNEKFEQYSRIMSCDVQRYEFRISFAIV
jgi:hypothetical protein